MTPLLSAWTDGLESNLLAEFTGLIASIVATYLIVDKVIDANRRRRHRPLRELLRRVAGQSLAASTFFWAYQMGLVSVGNLKEAIDVDLADRVTGSIRTIGGRLVALESADERERFLSEHEPRVILEIARQTIEDFEDIASVAAEVREVLQEDEHLETLVGNLEADARTLSHVHSFSVYLRDFEDSQDLPLDLLIERSVVCYGHGLEVWQYLSSQGEKR